MISWFLLALCLILIILSYVDIKYRAIPSVVLTGLLFIVAILRIENLQFGILAGLFAWVMGDLLTMKGLEFGMADIKIIAMMGLLIPTMNMFLIFLGIFAVFQFVYTLLWQWRMGKDDQRPFIPCLFAVFMAMWLIGGFV